MTTVRPLTASSCNRYWAQSISITAAIYENQTSNICSSVSDSHNKNHPTSAFSYISRQRSCRPNLGNSPFCGSLIRSDSYDNTGHSTPSKLSVCVQTCIDPAYIFQTIHHSELSRQNPPFLLPLRHTSPESRLIGLELVVTRVEHLNVASRVVGSREIIQWKKSAKLGLLVGRAWAKEGASNSEFHICAVVDVFYLANDAADLCRQLIMAKMPVKSMGRANIAQ